jgi:hypothetical protein
MTLDEAEQLARAEAARRGLRWEPAREPQRLARYGRCGPPEWQFTLDAADRVTIRIDDRTGQVMPE